MKIELKEIKVRDLFKRYKDSGVDGVVGFDGKLDIRPPFQREFIYNEKQKNAVINTVKNGFPLNVMYWSKNHNSDTYELLDGQQRTISICQYCNNDYSIDYRYMSNLTKIEQNKILDYPLMIYICDGNDKEKLEWFKTINIAGLKLKDQELRNAIYAGYWLTDAKKHFSKPNCVAYNLGKDYIKGTLNRQDYLETVLKWIANRDGLKNIEDVMSRHQLDNDSANLWVYYQQVISWVKAIFPIYFKEMKGVDWGILYNKYHDGVYNPNNFEIKVKNLMMDDDVTKKSGVYEYLFDGQEKHLSIRVFNDNMKRSAYERQNGTCVKCRKHFEIEEMEADHITPWAQGGKTTESNCQMLCKDCNRTKSDI